MVEVMRWLDREKVREMCIKYRYYTCGDCRAYEAMLEKANLLDTDDLEAVKQIAIDIYNHSTLKYDKGYALNDHIAGLVYVLLTDCTDMYVEVDDYEEPEFPYNGFQNYDEWEEAEYRRDGYGEEDIWEEDKE